MVSFWFQNKCALMQALRRQSVLLVALPCVRIPDRALGFEDAGGDELAQAVGQYRVGDADVEAVGILRAEGRRASGRSGWTCFVRSGSVVMKPTVPGSDEQPVGIPFPLEGVPSALRSPRTAICQYSYIR